MPAHELREVAILLSPDDDVAVVKRPIRAGEEIAFDGAMLRASRQIPAGHKISLRSIEKGSPVKKYGQFIGEASQSIAPGEHVHTHNLQLPGSPRVLECAQPGPQATNRTSKLEARSFMGFARSGGRVGTRNYIAIISSVNCSASVARYVADHFRGNLLSR